MCATIRSGRFSPFDNRIFARSATDPPLHSYPDHKRTENCLGYSNKLQSRTADFAPGAATWLSRPNNVVRRQTGTATWRTGRNIRVIFDSDLFRALYENMTPSTKPEVHNLLHCRQRRTELRPQVTCTKHLVKFGL